MELCKKCSRPLPERQPGAGRPKIYCGPTCRRAAAFEIGRVTRAIDGLEASLSFFRTSTLGSLEDPKLIEAELLRQRERLHELLLEPEDEKEASE
jgi:hypothetical protein